MSSPALFCLSILFECFLRPELIPKTNPIFCNIYINDEEYTTFKISNITTVVGNGGYNMGGGAPGQQGGRR